MIKKITLSGVGILMLASPLFASADVLSDLQAQIQSLLAQVVTLKAQMGVSGGVSISGTSCISLTNSLSADDIDADNNGEITKLQQFLAQEASIYPEGLVTGYFGPATMRAVQRWQKARGVVSSGTPDTTGYGFVGARTRAALAQGCGGSMNNTTGNNMTSSNTQPTSSANNTNTSGNPAIHVISPNGGTYIAGSGTPLTIQWNITNAPANGKMCATLIRIRDNHHFAFPPENVCVPAFNGVGSMQGNLTRTSGYDLGPGSYNLKLDLYGTPRTYGKDTLAVATVTSNNPIQLVEQSNVQTNSVVINYFTASLAAVNAGGAVMFMWGSNLSQNDISYYGGGCSIEGITQNNVAVYVTSGFKGASSQITFVPPATATYTLHCTSNAKDGSPSASKQITVNVAQPQTNPVTISSFTVSPTSVTLGQPVTFTWKSNLTSNDISYYGGGCSIEGITQNNVAVYVTSGFKGASSQITFVPPATATYTLHCTSNAKDGSPMATKPVTVPVN